MTDSGRRAFIRGCGLFALASLLPNTPGCSTLQQAPRAFQSTELADHPLVGRTWDVRRERFVPAEALIEALGDVSFALIGEIHDNPDHHALQAEWLDALARRSPRAVVFEQFDREYEPALRERMSSAKPNADDVAVAVNFDRSGWNWNFYRPLVEVALRYRMPIHAGNLSRETAREIARRGLAALPPERVATLRRDRGWREPQEHALRKIIAEGHCGALPDTVVPRMALAQRARDATLAEALLTQPLERATLIAGNGHVRRDIGVPVYLSIAAPERTSCAVGIVEVERDGRQPHVYASSAVAGSLRYDFVYFTPRWTRGDPCAEFHPR